MSACNELNRLRRSAGTSRVMYTWEEGTNIEDDILIRNITAYIIHRLENKGSVATSNARTISAPIINWR
ncbi:hypothetical protein D3C75_1130940 [compost metagenome]